MRTTAIDLCVHPACCLPPARKIIGATNPLASDPGTIRGAYAIDIGRNVIHG